MNKKIIWGIVVVVLIAIGVVYYYKSTWISDPKIPTEENVLTSDRKTYVNDQVGISLKIPKTFLPSTQKTAPEYLIVFYDSQKDFPNPEVRNLMSIHKPISADGAASFPDYIEKYPLINANNNKPYQFISRTLGSNTFYFMQTERFEGTLSYAYFTFHNGMVYRFDSTSQGVAWSDQSLDVEADPVHLVLKESLSSLKFLY
jgi:hypothetical protein